MWPGGGAAVGVVAELVDVQATFGVGVVAVDLVGDGGRGRVVGLLEGDGSADFGVAAEDCDWVGGSGMSVIGRGGLLQNDLTEMNSSEKSIGSDCNGWGCMNAGFRETCSFSLHPAPHGEHVGSPRHVDRN